MRENQFKFNFRNACLIVFSSFNVKYASYLLILRAKKWWNESTSCWIPGIFQRFDYCYPWIWIRAVFVAFKYILGHSRFSCVLFFTLFPMEKNSFWDFVRFLNRWYKKNSQNETRFRVFTRLYIVCVNDMSQCKNTQLFVLFYLVSFILSSFLVWIVYSLSLFLSFIRFICKFTQIFNTSIPFAMWMYFEFIWTDSDIICEHSIDT